MRRADRLFMIVQRLRGGRLVTAHALAEALEISERTVYRDMRDLMASGVPIDGEAGVGYVLRSGFDLPPLMFTTDEITALVVGARLVQSYAGASLAAAAAEALVKIEAVLPPGLRSRIAATHLYAPDLSVQTEVKERLDVLRDAIDRRRPLTFGYVRDDGERSHRTARPLGLYFWSGVWTLASWCEARADFRSFRVDRMSGVDVGERPFPQEKGRTLADYLARVIKRAS